MPVISTDVAGVSDLIAECGTYRMWSRSAFFQAVKAQPCANAEYSECGMVGLNRWSEVCYSAQIEAQ